MPLLRLIRRFEGKDIMKTTIIARGLAAALVALSFAGVSNTACADTKDYEFELVQPTVQIGADKVVTVRLVNK